jgi:cytochrome bd-type quinol oxidase subunit 1
MDNLLAARSQMAMSLAFHIVFAAVGLLWPRFMKHAGSVSVEADRSSSAVWTRQ